MSYPPTTLKKYPKRSIGEIHSYARGSSVVKFAPLPNFYERTEGHEALTYCRYWFGENFSIKHVDMSQVLYTIADVPWRTYVVVVFTQRHERVIHSRDALDELLAQCPEPPTAAFEITSPHSHRHFIELVIFRGESPPIEVFMGTDQPSVPGMPQASTLTFLPDLEALPGVREYEVSPDELANDMPNPLEGKFHFNVEYFFGRSVPTRWTPFLSQADAPPYYKFPWGWR